MPKINKIILNNKDFRKKKDKTNIAPRTALMILSIAPTFFVIAL
jgi:hypothetical protein